MRTASLLLAVGLASAAAAHPLAPSLLELTEHEPGRIAVRWKTPLMSVSGYAPRPLLPAGCEASGAPEVVSEPTAIVTRWAIVCPAGLAGRRIAVEHGESRGVVLLRVRLADGRHFQRVLDPDASAFVVPVRDGALSVARSYARLGVDHILTGADHLLFVLGLVLLVPGRRQLLGVVTAFTVGHSVTLSLAALGVVRFPPAPIEALIAATIFLLAVELGREAAPTRMRRYPWAVAFGCGLLHGLGFAGALAEVGLPAADIPLALASFNAGIEVGQLAFILAVLVGRRGLRSFLSRLPAPAHAVPRYALGSLAAYWLFARLAEMV